MATTTNCIKAIFDGNKENNGFGDIIVDNGVFQLKSSNLVTMATTKRCIKVGFYTNNDGGNNNKILGKLSRTTVVSVNIKSYNQLNVLNLVTMATAKIRKKPF